LQGRLSTSNSNSPNIKRQPDAASQANLGAARQALDERLDKVEQALGVSARCERPRTVQSRLEQIETRLEKTQRTPLRAPLPVPRRAPEAAQPKVVEPPFLILGTELRGGESFLSIAPSATQRSLRCAYCMQANAKATGGLRRSTANRDLSGGWTGSAHHGALRSHR